MTIQEHMRSRSDAMSGALWTLLYITIPNLVDGNGKHDPETLLEIERIESSWFAPCPRPCNGRPDSFSVAECVAAGECGCLCGERLASRKGRRP
jgi:hypothetical protein